jgi:S-adenosylmethionine synthetase
MSVRDYVFTSESVTEGHPDKVCDGISDAILDAILAQDPKSRVACEALAKTGMIVVAGEITTNAVVNYADIVRKKVCKIGYTHSDIGFDGNICAVLVALDKQSPDIGQGVDAKKAKGKATAEQGAGDQGMMFGYACDETKELMPMPITLAHQPDRGLSNCVRKAASCRSCVPTANPRSAWCTRTTVPVAWINVVISTQHAPDVEPQGFVREAIIEKLIKKVVPAKLLTKRRPKFFINPTGRFVVGGPQGDCGLTGRKIIVDTYGGMGRHGGGAFSGKDPSKVDRSAAYMARYVAKNIVAAGLARRAKCRWPTPSDIPSRCPCWWIPSAPARWTMSVWPRRCARCSASSRPRLSSNWTCKRPIYEATSAYGHFGRTENLDSFTWERTDKVEALKSAI